MVLRIGKGVDGFHTAEGHFEEGFHFPESQVFIGIHGRAAAILDHQFPNIPIFFLNPISFRQFVQQILSVTAVHHQMADADQNSASFTSIDKCDLKLALVLVSYRLNSQAAGNFDRISVTFQNGK